MLVSYIVPHRNRLELFEPNLVSLLGQTDKNFEVVVVDHSDEPTKSRLIQTVKRFRELGLKIRLVFIDPTKHPHAHHDSSKAGNYNPAYAQNLGVRRASGEVVVLTSPEVVNARENIAEIRRLFADGRQRFALGWIDERPLGLVRPYLGDLSVSTIKKLCAQPGNAAMCRDDVPSRPWLPINYFLGMIRRDDFLRVGGIDERFMGGVAWEDDEFATRLAEQHALRAEFCPTVAGIHLTHSRSYQVLENSNKKLWSRLAGQANANLSSAWGSDDFVVEEA